MKRSTALRVGDLMDRTRLQGKLDTIVDVKRRVLQALYGQDGGLDSAAICEALSQVARRLRPLVWCCSKGPTACCWT
ncbi:MAG: hypothetical protein ACYSVY_26195, partial [Planctomycetota bacterium]|jgi:adenylosuccinate synthase